MDEATLYDALGKPFFVQLVEDFYEFVEADEILRPMYPDDLTEAKHHLVLFLIQYWGGPAQYMAERGHPRLRMRHSPFRITKRARDAWLGAMKGALERQRDNLTAEQFDEMAAYFEMAAHQLRNV